MSDSETPERVILPTPDDLEASGAALWTSIVVPYDLEDHEVHYLVTACLLADRVDELEVEIDRHGITVAGSQGQVRVNPAVIEVRQTRETIARCLGRIAFPAADDQPATYASVRGRQAAEKRWRRSSGA